MSPYAILGGILLWLASLGAVGWWQHGAGVNAQKVIDQGRFDKVNKDLTAQKTAAAGILAKANADTLAVMAERDTLKTNLEKEHASNSHHTDVLAAQYAGQRLRFAVQGSGCGHGGGGAPATAGSPAAPGPAAVIQLPDQIAGDLRQLALDADRLRDEYALCYGYATQVK